ncbi:unnamed protein product [Orchesella dallaii]|uniref:N-acyl-aliphatic-L-amino acid amidohydrolase n=1 Tax=Orchesella dallaii TaxID=48710 RepID=A0ABP1Q4E9_9HEXA
MDNGEHKAVTNFREYLRIKSVHPNPDYEGCIEWIKRQATEIGLEFNIVEFPKPAEFAVWLTWPAKTPTLSSILLNSHIDVVPVDETKWTRDPFAAEKDSDGNIYARGTQDMKSVGVQYLEAIRNLKAKGFVPLRTIHVLFVPDEEVGGSKGMAPFVKSPEFAKLNVGFALDEGITSPVDEIILTYAERAICQVKFTAKGTTGHSLILHENTAGEKIQKVINRLMEFRAQEKARLESDPNLLLGDVTTVNLTMLGGGMQINICPTELSASFDIRLTPKWKKEELLRFLDEICEEAGPEVTYNYVFQSLDYTGVTTLDDSNKWWSTFKSTCEDIGVKLKPIIMPGATDIRYVRQQGIPAFGFSPINNTPVLLHANDEFLNESVFLRGIEIYEMIIWNLANIPGYNLFQFPKLF